MLLRQDGEDVLVIGQASHAWLSGQLARAWGNERFPTPSPREEVCLAATQHDIGWIDWDTRPTLDPATGLPHSFLRMPGLATHIELWSSAPDRLLSQSTYAALLVSMHGTALYARRDLAGMSAEVAALVRDYLAAESERQDRLRGLVAPDEDQLARNQRLIWTWDSLSLAVCLPWDPHTATRVPSAAGVVDLQMRGLGADRFQITPWPFAVPELHVRCEARRLRERFEDQAMMRRTLAMTAPEPLTFTLTQ